MNGGSIVEHQLQSHKSVDEQRLGLCLHNTHTEDSPSFMPGLSLTESLMIVKSGREVT